MSASSAAQSTGQVSFLSEQEHRAQLRRAVIASDHRHDNRMVRLLPL